MTSGTAFDLWFAKAKAGESFASTNSFSTPASGMKQKPRR
jgi:hypothetical protein